LLWKTLQKEFKIDHYWGVDVKSKKGRLAIDSVRVVKQPGWNQNVIDIDTYGSPWKHWEALLPNVVVPATVFLTVGQYQMGTDKLLLKALGLDGLKVPPGIARKLHKISVPYCLTRCHDFGIMLTEVIESVPVAQSNARYFGVRLEADTAVKIPVVDPQIQ
jgi:hypothetical protein